MFCIGEKREVRLIMALRPQNPVLSMCPPSRLEEVGMSGFPKYLYTAVNIESDNLGLSRSDICIVRGILWSRNFLVADCRPWGRKYY